MGAFASSNGYKARAFLKNAPETPPDHMGHRKFRLSTTKLRQDLFFSSYTLTLFLNKDKLLKSVDELKVVGSSRIYSNVDGIVWCCTLERRRYR